MKQQRHLREAQTKFNAAIESLASIKRRNDLVYEFFKMTGRTQITDDGRLRRSYLCVKEDAERRNILLRWILQQIRLIELESNSVNGTGKNSSRPDVRVQRSSKRGRADGTDGERCLKRQRQGSESSISDCRIHASTANSTERHLKRRQHDSENDLLPFARPIKSTPTIDSRSTQESVARRPPTIQGYKPTAPKKAKARSMHYSAPRKIVKEDTMRASNVLLSETRARKASRVNGRSSNHSTLGPRLRRSTRTRKPPDRFH